MLLGASICWELMCSNQIKPFRRTPIIQQTQLGWIVSGSIPDNNSQLGNKSYCGVSTNDVLQRQLQKFWHIEELEQCTPRSLEEIQCEKHFTDTHTRNSEGRFVVQLPLNDNIKILVKGRLLLTGNILHWQPFFR